MKKTKENKLNNNRNEKDMKMYRMTLETRIKDLL
jgi:hypothetical protein